MQSSPIRGTHTPTRTPSAVWCVMRETISSANGLSPPCRSADLSQSHSYGSIYTCAAQMGFFFFSNRGQFMHNRQPCIPAALPCPHLLLRLLHLPSSHPPSFGSLLPLYAPPQPVFFPSIPPDRLHAAAGHGLIRKERYVGATASERGVCDDWSWKMCKIWVSGS